MFIDDFIILDVLIILIVIIIIDNNYVYKDWKAFDEMFFKSDKLDSIYSWAKGTAPSLTKVAA